MADFNWKLAMFAPTIALTKYAIDSTNEKKAKNIQQSTKPKAQANAKAKDQKVEAEVEKTWDALVNVGNKIKDAFSFFSRFIE